jgi:glucose dehydrogenase
MTSSYRWILLIFVANVLVMPAVVAPQSVDDGHVSPSKEWPLVHGDWTNQRYSTLSQINTNTVKNLGGAWMSKKFEDGASTRSAPVVKDGVMYVNAGARVYALMRRPARRSGLGGLTYVKSRRLSIRRWAWLMR